MSHDDFRVFDSNGRPVAVMHHFGKNPYAALDPLEMSNMSNAYDHVSVCQVWVVCSCVVGAEGLNLQSYLATFGAILCADGCLWLVLPIPPAVLCVGVAGCRWASGSLCAQ